VVRENAFFGHAVYATEIATFGNADAEVIMLSMIGVGQEG
jgi:hypothetical protein